jgi:23S rRNA (uracil1939-C5)-methyltransferase
MNIELTIEKLVYGGEGLGRVNGEIILTPLVLPGEVIDAATAGDRQKVRRARLISLKQASPARVDPPCPVFGRCGGCHYQHIAYDSQLEYRREILSETLRRVGRIEFDSSRIDVIASEPFGYRNRAQFHFEDARVGYRALHSRALVGIEECSISSPKINEAIKALNRMVRDSRWPRFLGSLEIFTDESSVQWNVLETERPVALRFFEWLAAEVPGTVSGPLDYAAGADRFRVSGNSFFQINRGLLPRLPDLVLGDLKGQQAWDLYAGVGLFSVELARRFESVTAVESGRSAVDDLAENARRARVRVNAVARSVEDFLATAKGSPDLVVADPPRAGLGPRAVARLLELRPAALTLIACDPATLARDLKGLMAGYEIERITLVDLFPQTFHIETIVYLRRTSSSPSRPETR